MRSFYIIRDEVRFRGAAVVTVLALATGCGEMADPSVGHSSWQGSLTHDAAVITTQPTWCGNYTGSPEFQYSAGAYDPYSGDSLTTTWTHSEILAAPSPAVVQDFVNETCPVGDPSTCAASDDLSNLDITSGTLALSGGRALINALNGPFRAVFDVDSLQAPSRDLRWERQSVRARVSVDSVPTGGGQVVLFGRYNTEYDLYAAIFRFNSDGSVDGRLKRKLCGYYMGVPDNSWVGVPQLGNWSGLSGLELRFDITQDAQARWWLKLYARPSANVPWGSAIVAQRVATINGLPGFAEYAGQVDPAFELPSGTAGFRLDTIQASVDSLRLDVP